MACQGHTSAKLDWNMGLLSLASLLFSYSSASPSSMCTCKVSYVICRDQCKVKMLGSLFKKQEKSLLFGAGFLPH